MESFLQDQMRLIQCYRGSSSSEEANEKCAEYAEKMKRFVNDGGLEYPNMMKSMWRSFYKTRNYYKLS